MTSFHRGKNVTGGGVKFRHFCVTSFMDGPHDVILHVCVLLFNGHDIYVHITQ